MSNAINPTGIDAVFYLAKDYDRGLAFYRDVMGLQIAHSGENFTEFALGDGSAFGISYMAEAWYPSGGVMFSVPDIDVAAERLRAAGVQFYSGIIDTPVCRQAWVGDTEGNTFAIHQPK